MVDESCRMEPRTQLKNTGPTERLRDQEKDGKMLYSRKYTMISEERHENITRMRRNSHNKQTSEIRQWSATERRRSSQHHMTQIEKKIKVKSENEDFFLESRSSSAISSACITPKKLLENSSSYAIKNFVMGGIQEQRDGLTSKFM